MQSIEYREKEISKLEARIINLRHRYNEESRRIIALRNDKLIEANDVKELKQFSFKNMFLKMIRRHESSLAKEEKEAYVANAKYSAALYNLEMLKVDILNNENELEVLKANLKDFKEKFANTSRLMLMNNEIAKEKMGVIRDIRGDIEYLERVTKLNSRVKRKLTYLINKTDGINIIDIVSVFEDLNIAKGMEVKRLDSINSLLKDFIKDSQDLSYELTCVNADVTINLDLSKSIDYLNVFLDCVFYGVDEKRDLSVLNSEFKALKAHLDILTGCFRDTINAKKKELVKCNEDYNKYILSCTN